MALDASALSDRQFRRKVFEELQNAGTIDGLKGTLRSRLVGVLQRRDPGVFQGSGPGPGQQSLWQRAANSLYVEYLNHQNYGYALSVFQPECGLFAARCHRFCDPGDGPLPSNTLGSFLCRTPTRRERREPLIPSIVPVFLSSSNTLRLNWRSESAIVRGRRPRE